MSTQEEQVIDASKVDEKRKVLTAEDILCKDDIETVDCYVPEWGGTVKLRSLSGLEAERFVAAFPPGERQSASAVHIVALCAIKEDGTPFFTSEQVEELKKKSLRGIMRLQKEVLRINGLSEEGLKETKNA